MTSPRRHLRRVRIRATFGVASLFALQLGGCASDPQGTTSAAGSAGALAGSSSLAGGSPAATGGSSGNGGTTSVGAGGQAGAGPFAGGVVGTGGTPSTGGASSGASGIGTAGTNGGSAQAGVGGVGPGGTGGVGPNGGAGPVAGAAGSTGGGAGGGTGAAGGVGGAGDGPLGPDLTDVSAFTPATCTITPTVTPASEIPMVGVATFTTDMAGASSALIQFGKTAEYTLEAPVNWAEADHRTLLLGMPANTLVHYRVVAISGNTACVGPDATYMTGPPVQGAPGNLTPQQGTSTVDPAPGFIIAERDAFAYIINKQGEVVWAYRFPINLTRALMSWDGHYMIARELGPFNAGSGGQFYRVAMDGSGEQSFDLSGGTHHDFTVTPDGIAYPGKQSAGQCDSLYTANHDGTNSQPLVNLEVVFGEFENGPGSAAMEECHVNAIHYYSDIDAFSLSDREKDTIAFVSSSGEVLGSVGATPAGSTPNHAKAEGADSTMNSAWRVQHGHDWYAPDKLVVWSNGLFMGGQSRMLHYTISGATATLDWQYAGTGNSPTMSDAQHLPNGNFLGTASQSGSVHEIDPSQTLVQSWSNLSRGYTHHRPTLYGRPPGR